MTILKRADKIIDEQNGLILAQNKTIQKTIETLEGLNLRTQWQMKQINDLKNECKNIIDKNIREGGQ